jgi:hypothetical protein
MTIREQADAVRRCVRKAGVLDAEAATDRIEAAIRAAGAPLAEALRGLKTGGCYCDMGIGDPRFSDHDAACKKARAALAAWDQR